MNAHYPKGKSLAMDLSRILSQDDEIVVKSDDNPVFFEYEGQGFCVYLKCMCWGGKSYSENTTRAQLPKHKIFSKIKESDLIFMFWGYDVENQVYVCWNPEITKARLNNKDYVSFFSRKKEQEKAIDGHPNQAYLTNGLKYICFKTIDSIYVIKHLSDFFPIRMHKYVYVNEPGVDEEGTTLEKPHPGILNNVVEDLSVKLLIDNLRSNQEAPVLTIISKTMNSFESDYPLMSLKDWYRIIEDYINNNPIEDNFLTEDS